MFGDGSILFMDDTVYRAGTRVWGYAFVHGTQADPSLAGRILIFSGSQSSWAKQHVLFHEAAHFTFFAGDSAVANPSIPYKATAEQIANYCQPPRTAWP